MERNYTLRFRNMHKPDNIIVKNNEKDITPTYKIEKNDLIVNVNEINTQDKLEVFIIGNNIEIENLSLVNEQLEGILDDLEISIIKN